MSRDPGSPFSSVPKSGGNRIQRSWPLISEVDVDDAAGRSPSAKRMSIPARPHLTGSWKRTVTAALACWIIGLVAVGGDARSSAATGTSLILRERHQSVEGQRQEVRFAQRAPVAFRSSSIRGGRRGPGRTPGCRRSQLWQLVVGAAFDNDAGWRTTITTAGACRTGHAASWAERPGGVARCAGLTTRP